MLRLLALLTAVLSPAVCFATAVPDDRCVVVMASRADMAGVGDWVRANPSHAVDGLYRASNGYLAISGGVIPLQGWNQEVARRKASGSIPADAFCSRRGIVGQVWRRGDGSAPPWVSAASSAGSDAGLFTPFDARSLDSSEKRVLQAALAVEGAYAGLLDSAWGQGSQRALDGWTQEAFGRDATFGDAALALELLTQRIGGEGWGWSDPTASGVFLFLPLGTMTRSMPEAGRTDFQDLRRGILVIVDESPAAEVAGLHAEFQIQPAVEPPYVVRKEFLWITSVRQSDAGDVYVRSDRTGRGWVTTLVAAPRDETADNLIVASIGTPGPPPIALPPGGAAAGWVGALHALLANEAGEQDRNAAGGEGARAAASAMPPGRPLPPPPSPAQPEQGFDRAQGERSSGTGFRVAADGTVLTNHHVVEGCNRMTADGLPAILQEASESFDLAVLSVPGGAGKPWLPMADSAPRLNADVTVAGYPLHGLLGGVNVTRGAISAMRGLGGDDHTMQVSAPIQPGNSGGAVVDAAGRVVGVVVAKLDEEALRRETGTISQNVNFAIRGDIARLMLDRSGVAYATAPTGPSLPPEELAERLTAATVLLLCY